MVCSACPADCSSVRRRHLDNDEGWQPFYLRTCATSQKKLITSNLNGRIGVASAHGVTPDANEWPSQVGKPLARPPTGLPRPSHVACGSSGQQGSNCISTWYTKASTGPFLVGKSTPWVLCLLFRDTSCARAAMYRQCFFWIGDFDET